MRVPVLTYHAMNVNGVDYATNDHLALAEDLALLRTLGMRVLPLHEVVATLLGERPDAPENAVALSFDDGAWFDWHDLVHPSHGPTTSFANLLRAERRRGVAIHATSFVIVSPQARAVLDRTCMVDAGWWDDGWWPEATREGLIAIENHSWDHNHATLPATAQRDGRTGTFRTIETWAEADAEIRQAADFLDRHCAPACSTLFAYPYGETSPYLVQEYFPKHRSEHRVRAAFATGPEPVTRASDRWALPRYVCGHHWQSPAGLERLLRDLRRTTG